MGNDAQLSFLKGGYYGRLHHSSTRGQHAAGSAGYHAVPGACAKSAVTSQPLAAAFTKLLGVEVATSRSTFVQGRPGDTLLLGEYNGPPHSYIEDGVVPPGGGVRWVKIQL